ncbi:multiple monosaccharide ABC transporter substrate-binding protein [Streptomyces sp. NPDC088354]|uniref:multiple monosaccharide ABC transporter substrate-binding protein n=1 Tax=Streptomyces sp. NPDC088354 TaxID=3365856 RepID=UPI00381CF863
MRSEKPVRNRSILRVAIVLPLLAASAVACGDDSAGNREVSVGIAMPNKLQTRWADDAQNMTNSLESKGYTVDVKYAADDVNLQVDQIQGMVDAGEKVIIIGAVDGYELGEVLKNAARKGVKIIAYDRLLLGSSNVDYYASFDNYKVGQLQAEYIVDKLGLKEGKGPFNLEIFAGDPDDNNAVFFYNGSMAVLKPWIDKGLLVLRSGNRRITQVTTWHWDGEVAHETMITRLHRYFRSATLDAVLAPNDGIARGVIQALRADGYGSDDKDMPIITGQDAEVDSIKEIIKGEQSMTVYKDTRRLAAVAVDMSDAIIAGKTPKVTDNKQYDNGSKVVPAYLLAPVAVDKSNYKKLLIDSGYINPSDLK